MTVLTEPAPASFTTANAARSAAAAARTVNDAADALRALPSDADPELYAVLRVRAGHPDATLAELADKLGMTKDQYAGRLRRALDPGPPR